jgi:folylpolyglutamate synthase/dihydropteroate synthase
VKSLSETLRVFAQVFGPRRAALLFACAGDKNAESMARLFADHAGAATVAAGAAGFSPGFSQGFSPITLTTPGAAKKADPQRLQAAFRAARLAYRFDADYTAAILRCLGDAAALGQPVLAAGSFYLAGEVKKLLR